MAELALTGSEKSGYFTIYKKGQGYWTRMGTLIGATIIAFLIVQYLYTHGRTWFTTTTIKHNLDGSIEQATSPAMGKVLGLCGGFLIVFFAIVHRVMNKPRVVEFLIATDSEMKKVNWTSRAELMGSTKVVIVFMVLVSVILFFFDTFFGQLFYMLKILKVGPFQ